jgi:hypothetical protein
VVHQSVDDCKGDAHDTHQYVREREVGNQYVGYVLSFSLFLKDNDDERQVSKEAQDQDHSIGYE